jgi:hypothetical protein
VIELSQETTLQAVLGLLLIRIFANTHLTSCFGVWIEFSQETTSHASPVLLHFHLLSSYEPSPRHLPYAPSHLPPTTSHLHSTLLQDSAILACRDFLGSSKKEDFVCRAQGDMIGSEVAEMFRFVFDCMTDERPPVERPFSSTLQSCTYRKRQSEIRCRPPRGSGALLDALDLLTVNGTFPQPSMSSRSENNPGERKDSGSYAPLDELWTNALMGNKQDIRPDEHHPRPLFDQIWKTKLSSLPEGRPLLPALMRALQFGLRASKADIEAEIARAWLKLHKQLEESLLTEKQKSSGHTKAVQELVARVSASGKARTAELKVYLLGLGLSKSRITALGNLPWLLQEIMERMAPAERVALDERARALAPTVKNAKKRKKMAGPAKPKAKPVKPKAGGKSRKKRARRRKQQSSESSESSESDEAASSSESEEAGFSSDSVDLDMDVSSNESKEGGEIDDSTTVPEYVMFFEAHRLSWKKMQEFAAVVAQSRPTSDPLHTYPRGSRNKSAGAYAIERALIPRLELSRFLTGGWPWEATAGVQHMQKLWQVCVRFTELNHTTLQVGQQVVLSDGICTGWGVCTAVEFNPTKGNDGWQFKLQRSDSCDALVQSVKTECPAFKGWSWSVGTWLILKGFHVVPWEVAFEQVQSFD